MKSEIEVYNQFSGELAEYKQSANFLPDTSTSEGYEASTLTVKEGRKLYNKIDRTRKKIKEQPLRMCQMIDSEAKVFKDDIQAMIEPHATAIQEEDDKVKLERERLANLFLDKARERIAGIDALSFADSETSVRELEERLSALKSMTLDEADYGILFTDAKQVLNSTAYKVAELVDSRKKKDKEAEELAKLKADKAEADKKIADLEADKEAVYWLADNNIDVKVDAFKGTDKDKILRYANALVGVFVPDLEDVRAVHLRRKMQRNIGKFLKACEELE